MLDPKFKLAFVTEEEQLQCREMLLSYVQKVHGETQASVVGSGSTSSLADNAHKHDDITDFHVHATQQQITLLIYFCIISQLHH